MSSTLEHIYTSHHATRRGKDFILLGDERGTFLREHISTGKKVLDVGCRDGALTARYAEGNTVTGLDIDASALARALESIPGIEVRQTDLNGEWGVSPASYDVVVAAEVVEHLYYPATVFEKAASALVSGGVLLGTVPNAFSLINRFRYLLKQKKNTPLMDPTHINHFTVAELQELLEEHFVDVAVVGLGRLGWLARTFPQAFAFDLAFCARKQ